MPLNSYSLPRIFNETSWVGESTKIIAYLNSSPQKSIDMTKIEWADPVPLLWLCLTIRDFSEVKLEIDIDSNSIHHKRFLCFFLQQGFFEEYSKFSTFLVKNSKQQPDILEKKILNLNIAPIYENVKCIAATVKSISELRGDLNVFIDELMDKAIQEVSIKIDASWSFYKDHAIQKLRNFTFELIENVIEHAYQDTNEGAVAIYARVRSGKSYIKPDSWESFFDKQNNNCFLLSNWEEFGSNGDSKWIEIFIVDNGVGLLANIEQWKTSNNDANEVLLDLKNSKDMRPLRKIGHQILSGGYSKDQRLKSKTKMTGLQLIHETLRRKERKDSAPGEYIRILTGREVVAGHLPFEKAQGRGGHYKVLSEGNFLTGTIFHACIEISVNEVELPKSFIPVAEKKLQELKDDVLDLKDSSILDVFVADQRYLRETGENYDKHRRPYDVINPKNYDLNVYPKEIKHLIWLPSDSITKKDIKGWIEHSIQSNLSSLTIADIPLHRARLFEYIVSTESINVGSSVEIDFSIYIITRNWNVANFTSIKQDDRHYKFQLGGGKSELGLEKLNKKLRENDSFIFWENVLTRKNSSFVKEEIIWDRAKKGANDKDIKIFGYLDFSESISKTINFKIIKAALERTIYLWKNQSIIIISLDDLVKPFSESFEIFDLNEITNLNKIRTFKKIILLGSTLVTGDTSKQIKLLITGVYPGVEIYEIYILQHPSRIQKNNQSENDTSHSRVLNWKEGIKIKAPSKGKEQYERLSGTPFIKRGGAKAYRINRTDNPSSAAEMYRDFSQGHLKIGHWEYDNSHDLLTPNLSRIIATTPALIRWFVETISELSSQDNKVKNILVYISHGVTGKLIDHLVNYESHGISKSYEIHALQKLNLGASQHIFFSPIVLEKIEEYSKKYALNIVLIDDGVISGATLRNAEASLLFNNEDKLTTLTIIDRNGFISSDNVRKSLRRSRKSYWIWDVPSLGKKGHCQLCHGVEGVNALSKRTANNGVKLRAQLWCDVWRLKKVTDLGWELAGVSPQELNTPYTMDFGSENISHKISTTLSSMSIEISNACFQPNFSLSKFYGYKKEELASAIDSTNISLEILTTHMYLLSDGLSGSKKVDYLTAILNLLWKSPSSNEYTALSGLIFITIEDSLKPLVWQEASKLIHEKGFRYNNNEDLALTCLSLIIDIPNIQEKLHLEKNKNTREDAKEAFSFLLSLIQNVDDLRRPISNFYRMFGSGSGKWHEGKFEQCLTGLPTFHDKEIDSKNLITGIISEAKKVISDLEKFEFIERNHSVQETKRLDSIEQKLLDTSMFIASSAMISNYFVGTKFQEDLWDYAQASPESISTYIQSKIKAYNANFKDYYMEKKSSSNSMIDDWAVGEVAPSIFIARMPQTNITKRYAFFKPFRDFIKDTIFNSIWAKPGIHNEAHVPYDLIVSIREDESGYLFLTFSNLIVSKNVRLHPRDYHTRINALHGEFTESVNTSGVEHKYVMTLKIPSTKMLLPDRGIQ